MYFGIGYFVLTPNFILKSTFFAFVFYHTISELRLQTQLSTAGFKDDRHDGRGCGYKEGGRGDGDRHHHNHHHHHDDDDDRDGRGRGRGKSCNYRQRGQNEYNHGEVFFYQIHTPQHIRMKERERIYFVPDLTGK